MLWSFMIQETLDQVKVEVESCPSLSSLFQVPLIHKVQNLHVSWLKRPKLEVAQ